MPPCRLQNFNTDLKGWRTFLQDSTRHPTGARKSQVKEEKPYFTIVASSKDSFFLFFQGMFHGDFTLMKDLLVGEKFCLSFLLALTLVFGRFGVSTSVTKKNVMASSDESKMRCVIGLAVQPDVAEGGLGSLPLLLGQGSLGATSCGGEDGWLLTLVNPWWYPGI